MEEPGGDIAQRRRGSQAVLRRAGLVDTLYLKIPFTGGGVAHEAEPDGVERTVARRAGGSVALAAVLLGEGIGPGDEVVVPAFAPVPAVAAVRLVGAGPSARLENRVPGGDVNPYLALAAMIAGGRHGIEQQLELPPPITGNAYAADLPTIPTSLQAARERFSASPVARAALSDEVVDHYTNMADVELAAFGAAVTDWELRRTFERM